MKPIKFLFFIFFIFNFISCNSKKQLEKKWINLKKSDTEQDEIKRIAELSEKIMNIGGSFRIYGITDNNDSLKIGTDRFDTVKLNHINISVYWKDNEFYGKNWKPINQENVYVFFRE
tara:strand:- start:7054 stop:7404 length:351 start_codon:yes stop_codon:yes gene_type:complete